MSETDSGQQLLFSLDLHTRVAELYRQPETIREIPEPRLQELGASAGAIAVSPEDLVAT